MFSVYVPAWKYITPVADYRKMQVWIDAYGIEPGEFIIYIG